MQNQTCAKLYKRRFVAVFFVCTRFFFIGCELLLSLPPLRTSVSYFNLFSSPPLHHNPTITTTTTTTSTTTTQNGFFLLLQLRTSLAILVLLVATKSLARPLQPPASLLSYSAIQHSPPHQPPRPSDLPTCLSRRHPHSPGLHRISKLLLPSPLSPPHHLLLLLPRRRYPRSQDAR